MDDCPDRILICETLFSIYKEGGCTGIVQLPFFAWILFWVYLLILRNRRKSYPLNLNHGIITVGIRVRF